jgi:4-diphosphocytidyl-2-C-methyl-D-erythritol kinase
LDKKIGSDLKLFFYEQGFLKNLKTINDFRRKYRLYFLLVYPNIRCSTRHVYSKVKKYSSKSKYSFSKINDKSKFIDFLINKNNDLQSIVENKYPIIKKLIIEIGQKKGCYFSRMTGSGSVCYGVFKSEKTAKVALNGIKLKYPKFWSSVAKTI